MEIRVWNDDKTAPIIYHLPADFGTRYPNDPLFVKAIEYIEDTKIHGDIEYAKRTVLQNYEPAMNMMHKRVELSLILVKILTKDIQLRLSMVL